MVLHPSQKLLGTDRKMASRPTAMRVWTDGRIKSSNPVRQAIPPQLRPYHPTPEVTLATSPNASAGTCATTAVERSVPCTTTSGPAGLTASGCTHNARPPGLIRKPASDRRHLRLRRDQGLSKGVGAACRDLGRAVPHQRPVLCEPSRSARGGGMVCRSVGAIRFPA